MRLGLDAYSLRSQGWTPFQQLEFCAARRLDVLHFSELRFLGNLAPDYLRRVRERADELGIALEVGMRSVCPSSTIFDASAGSADEQLARALDVAQLLGSPVLRCLLGRFPDRATPGGIERRIDDMVAVLVAVRSRVVDAGIRLAVENHAGDMQARELKGLVEAAGRDFVGVCLDSGNALWALEDPHAALETLAPYVLTSHVRDGVVWKVPEGAAVSWTRMGEGSVGIDRFLHEYRRACPACAVALEVIVSDEPRVLTYRSPGFWDDYRRMPASEFERFTALVERGSPVSRRPFHDGESRASREIEDIDVSLRWTRAQLDAAG